MASRNSRGSSPSPSARAIDWAVAAVWAPVNALQTSLSLLAAPDLVAGPDRAGSDRVEHGIRDLAQRRIARGQDRQRALLGRLAGAEHGRVEQPDAEPVGLLGHPVDVEPDRRGLDDDGLLGHPGPGRAEHVDDRVGVEEHHHHDVGAAHRLRRFVGHGRAVVGQWSGPVAAPVPDGHRVAVLES